MLKHHQWVVILIFLRRGNSKDTVTAVLDDLWPDYGLQELIV